MKPVEIKPLKPPKSQEAPNEVQNIFDKLKSKYPIINWAWLQLTSPEHCNFLFYTLLIFEAILSLVIVYKVPYTEIDWKAYVQQVEGFLSGEMNYIKLKGDTGPLVYPAGFLYIYSILFKLSQNGTNIQLAQFCFIGFYLIYQYLTFSLYRKLKLPPYLLIFLCLSKRFHSIFMLRLFNDPLAIIFVLCSIHLMFQCKYVLSTIFYSIGLSIKMNCLLFLPGYLYIIFNDLGFLNTLNHVFLIFITQIVIGFPFLNTFPKEYLMKSFEFSRKFEYVWTVNWKMVSETTFLSDSFSKLLLLYHLIILLAFLITRWSQPIRGGIIQFVINGFQSTNPKLINFEKFKILSICNLIGITFSRSLHFQFYSWYFFSIPFLLFETGYYSLISLILWIGIEITWNTYPSNEFTSMLLFSVHSLILIGCWVNYYKRLNPNQTRIFEMKLKTQ